MIKDFKSIDGATPLTDHSGLIPKWIQNMGDLNRSEAENIMKAQRKYLRRPVGNPTGWFNVKQLTSIHRDMYKDVWEWAGICRKSVTSIGIKPHLIGTQLAEHCKNVHYWLTNQNNFTPIEMSARVHHQLVFIHPFENGNGRFSRLIADRFLLGLNCVHPTWPINLNHEGLIRNEYIRTLKAADRGDYEPLISFMRFHGALEP